MRTVASDFIVSPLGVKLVGDDVRNGLDPRKRLGLGSSFESLLSARVRYELERMTHGRAYGAQEQFESI